MSKATSQTRAACLDGALGIFLLVALAGVHLVDRIPMPPGKPDPIVDPPDTRPDLTPDERAPALAENKPQDPFAADEPQRPAESEPQAPKPKPQAPEPLPLNFQTPRRPPAAVAADLFAEKKLNQFGNPEGNEFGLCRAGEFAGARLLVWTAEPQVEAGIYNRNNPLWAALKDKGFDTQIEYGAFDRRWLERVDQVWIFAGHQAALQRGDEEAIVSFVDAGRGVYLVADNAPYLVDVSNLAARLFGTQLAGDYPGENIIAVRGHGVTRDDYKRSQGQANSKLGNQDAESRLAQVINRATHYVEEHSLLTDVNFIYEGNTISHIDPTPNLQTVLTASDGQILAAVSRDPRRRVVVDCGFTRYFYSSNGRPSLVTETAGTLRYAENIAAYLMCKDDKRANGAKWREKRQLLTKYQAADRSVIVAGLKHQDPEERWAAIVGAIHQRLEIAEELIGMLRDPQAEIRSQARTALVQLAGAVDFGADVNASFDEWELAQRAWAKFFKRKQLFARAARLSPAELVAAFQNPDPDERLAALNAAAERRMDLAEQFIALVGDSEVEIRSEARQALARLAGDRDLGPAETASADEIKLVQQAWSVWLKRRGLLARAAELSGDELASWRVQADPDQRWAAVMAAIRKEIYVVQELIELLQDADSEIRKQAHQALVQLTKGRDIDPAWDRDEFSRTAARAKWHRWRVSRQFSELVTKAGPDVVVAALRAGDAEERWAAVIAIHDRRLFLIDKLLDTLDDQHAPVQQEARQTLRECAWAKEDFGPEPGAAPEEVAKAVRKWKACWEQVRENEASKRLKMAKLLMDKNPEAGRRHLQDVVKGYPKTQAAREAQRLLDELSRKKKAE